MVSFGSLVEIARQLRQDGASLSKEAENVSRFRMDPDSNCLPQGVPAGGIRPRGPWENRRNAQFGRHHL